MDAMMKRVLAIMVAAAVACSLAPALAFAADKTLSAQRFSTATSTIDKKAATVKRGTFKLVLKKGEGYVKFKAPSAKTYSFTFSNLRGKHVYSGFVSIQKPDARNSKYSFIQKVKTQGGKTTTLWLAGSGYASKSGKLLYRNLASRTAKVKMKKGQTLYFHIYTSGTSSKTLNMKVG